MIEWILARLKEPTTYAGIFAILTAAGVSLAPEMKEAIVTAGGGLVGLVLVVMKQKA